MRFLDLAARNQRLGWAKDVLDVVQDRGDEVARSQIQSAIDQFQTAPFSIAVLGKVKRGKSTLINALLGRHDDLAAPIDRLPASSAISRFRWREQEVVTVLFRDGRKESIPLARVREFATEESNPQNVKGVELLEIAGPFDGLDRELELVDTPGAGSIHEHHDTLLHAFIPQADSVIFMVTARMPLDQDELDLLRNIKAADISKLFFAINRIDEANDTDLADAVAHNGRLLAEAGIPVSKVHRISAKRAFQGQAAGSGVPELLGEVREFLIAQKGRVLEERLVSRVTQAANPALQRINFECEHARKSREELETERRQLGAKRLKLSQDRELVEREFRNAWNKALLNFEHALRSSESSTQAKVAQKIASSGLMDVSRLAKQLPTQLQQTVEAELSVPSQNMERELLAATQKLQADYPLFHQSLVEAHQVRLGDTDALLKGAAAGAVFTAVGGGVVAAGSAAAASIAAANTAALTATTTVAAPSVIGSLLANVPHIGGMLASLGTGTATVSARQPSPPRRSGWRWLDRWAGRWWGSAC